MIYWFINLFCLYQYALAETEIQSQQGTESAWKALYIIFNYYNSVCYSLYYGNPATIEYDAAQGRMMIMISSFYFIFYFLDYTYFCFADEFIKIMTTIADESGVFCCCSSSFSCDAFTVTLTVPWSVFATLLWLFMRWKDNVRHSWKCP